MKVYGLVLTALIGTAAIGATNVASSGDGKAIFLENKCQQCHSIKSLKIESITQPKPGQQVPPDLSAVGLRHKADWISKWLQKEVELEGKKHLKKFKGSDDDLTTLSTWLGTLKTKLP